MNELFIDRKTAAFYLTLLALVVLDLILILWILHAFSTFGTSAYASQKDLVVSDANKPSPFEIAASKAQPVQPLRRRQVRNVSLQQNTPPAPR